MKMRTIIVCAMLVGCGKKEAPAPGPAPTLDPQVQAILDKHAAEKKAEDDAKKAKQHAKRFPDTGEIGYAYIWDDHSAELLAFPTEELYDAWIESIGTDGKLGTDSALVAISSYGIKPGTQIKVVRGKLTILYVEILSGINKGKRGWMDKSFLHRAPLPAETPSSVSPKRSPAPSSSPRPHPTSAAPMPDAPF